MNKDSIKNTVNYLISALTEYELESGDTEFAEECANHILYGEHFPEDQESKEYTPTPQMIAEAECSGICSTCEDLQSCWGRR